MTDLINFLLVAKHMAVDSAELGTRVFDLIIEILESSPDLPPGESAQLTNSCQTLKCNLLARTCAKPRSIRRRRKDLWKRTAARSQRAVDRGLARRAQRCAVDLRSLAPTKTAMMRRAAPHASTERRNSPVNASAFTPFAGPMASVQRTGACNATPCATGRSRWRFLVPRPERHAAHDATSFQALAPRAHGEAFPRRHDALSQPVQRA